MDNCKAGGSVNIRVAGREVAALTALLVLGACNTRDRNATDTLGARADTATARTTAAADSSARRVDTAAGTVAKRGGWTDASILAFAGAANNGEIREGELAAKKGTNPAVKAFGRQIAADHRALMSEGKSLASKTGVKPDTADDDVRDLVKHSADDLKDLTDKTAGADWDKDFIDHEIKGHKDVLDKLQDAAKNTTNPQLRASLEKATGKVQQHLTKAQDIKDNALKNSTGKDTTRKDTTRKG
jgi:putative membrane protein